MKKPALTGVTGPKLILERSTLKQLKRRGAVGRVTNHTECDPTCIVNFCTHSATCTKPC